MNVAPELCGVHPIPAKRQRVLGGVEILLDVGRESD